jgi:transcriptional regulator with XRE-family HTH domain
VSRFSPWISGRLKQERRLAGLSQESLAEVLRVSAETIERYETGEEWLPADQLATAVAFLGISLSALFYDFASARSRNEVASDRWIAIRRPLNIFSSGDSLAPTTVG